MPDINPTPGDLIQIVVSGTTMDAKIMTKDQSGKYQVELGGDPPMRGLVDIQNYEWSHQTKHWIRLPQLNKLKAM